jgi:hypothetical protein
MARTNIITYNCRGYNEFKKLHINTMLERCDINFLQEHWLLASQTMQLNDINDDF